MILILICVSLLASALLFALGWELAVRRHRHQRRALEAAMSDLEEQVNIVNQQLRVDPQRAGIDMGKRYAINQVQTTIDRLRRELPR